MDVLQWPRKLYYLDTKPETFSMTLSRFLRHGAAALALSTMLSLASCKDQSVAEPGTEGASPGLAR